MAPASTTTTTECTKCEVPSSPTVALQSSQPTSSKPPNTEETAPEQVQDEKPARPYLKLLMPEPAPDQDCDPELRKEDCRYYFRVLSRGYVNKDWKSRPVFDDDDDEDDEPLAPLLGETW